MQRSDDQEVAWKQFLKWIATSKSQEFRLGGLAGTGKTTLVKDMRDQMGNCEVIAPTAKAAEVLCKKGVEARTCHSLLCNFEHETTDASGRTVPIFSDKKVSRDFLIVDEASMITGEMRRKILRCANRVVWVGDYGQLPPVDPDGSGESVMSEESLDAKLTMQHRHSDALGIIDFANFLRGGGLPEKWSEQSDQVIVNPEGVQSFTEVVQHTIDQKLWPVICYKNDFIKAFNQKARSLLGIKNSIEAGLKIVCIKNNFRFGIVNGEMFTIQKVDRYGIRTECGRSFPVTFDKNDRNAVLIQDGYAVTCHKAQGSEWPDIAVMEDKRACPRWRYTAATRAQKSITYFTNDEA